MRPLTWLLTALIRAYQLILSPHLPPSCRFFPSCSHYALLALQRHGALQGAWLTFKRILRCQPFCAAGHDPVP